MNKEPLTSTKKSMLRFLKKPVMNLTKEQIEAIEDFFYEKHTNVRERVAATARAIQVVSLLFQNPDLLDKLNLQVKETKESVSLLSEGQSKPKHKNDLAEFAVQTLRRYADQTTSLRRSTSDISPLEQWLLIELFNNKTEKDLKTNQNESETSSLGKPDNWVKIEEGCEMPELNQHIWLFTYKIPFKSMFESKFAKDHKRFRNLYKDCYWAPRLSEYYLPTPPKL